MKSIWVFHGANGKYSSAVFSTLKLAEKWIIKNRLNGMLTKYPLDQSVFDWAIENNMHNIKPEKVEEKASNSVFVGSFTTASQEHHHYQDGLRA
jgi:hypothetical protein